MSTPNVAGIWVEGAGSTFNGHNNIIRAFSDIAGATVRGAVITNGGTISSDNDDIAATALAMQTPHFPEDQITNTSYPMSGKAPINILSLDGGGVRGLSSLLILRKIMAQLCLKLGLDDGGQVRPCDFFDLICGTSTGGLIALMLGRLRMTVDECIEAYIKLSMEIFGKRTSFATFKRLGGGAQYSARILEEKIKNIVKSKTEDADAMMKDTLGNRCCRTFVAAIARDYADAPPIKFRTYSTTEFLADTCTIWQAARATSAATTFFDPVTFGTPKITYIDGALGGHNNPAKLAIDESKDIWPNCHFRCVISIGTGKPEITSVTGNLASIAKACIKLTTSCAAVDDEIHKEFARRGTPNPYFRFSVDRGLGSILLNEVEKQQEMAAITEAYMRFNAQAEQVKRCVHVLSERKATVET